MPARRYTQKTGAKKLFARLRSVARASSRASQPEQEQGLLRIIITALVYTYILFSWPDGEGGIEIWVDGTRILLVFLVFSIILLTSVLIRPQPSDFRKYIGIVGDVTVTSSLMHLTGVVGAPWYGVYLWVTLGNGFRYGEKFLYVSGVVSLLGFGAVVFTTPYWDTHIELAVGLAVTLLVIPAYSGILIRRLNEARARADLASRAKSDFLSRMSHEIRTPLNGILGMTDLLRTRPLEAEDKEYVETIYASGKALACQIDEILDLSKIEAGQLSLEVLEFDLYALINTTLRIFEMQVSEKKIQLQETINPNTPYLLCGDPHKLRQILINLIGNAVKFTEKGFVSLRVYPREQTREQVTLRFEVADTGTGIAEGKLETIFDPFTQADNSVARNYGGTGLGTTICKSIVELMGGEIGVQSMPGVGSTFWFDIPFDTGSQQVPGKDLSWTSECRLLRWCSGNAVGGMLTAALSNWQVRCTDIASIDELERTMVSATGEPQKFDALLIDGFVYGDEFEQVFQRLENDPLFASLCVVLVGAESYPPETGRRIGDRLFALNASVDERVFFNTLHACYSRHSTEDDVIHIARQQILSHHSSPLEILIADDNATNRVVLQRMLKKMGYGCTAVNGGEIVLTMLEDSHYDVVIIDKNMPDMGGIEVYQAYSMAYGGQGAAKFVVLTADATEESRVACQSAGIEYFLTKPVSLARLQEVLLKVSPSDRECRKREDSGTVARATAVQGFPVLDDAEFQKLELLAAGDGNFISDVVANFASDAVQDLASLESAVARHDRTAFGDSAHALKGAAMYLGLQQLAELCVEAQNTDHDEFERCGISKVKELRQAADAALKVLNDKLNATRKIG